jgi:hypothetical protein
MWEISVPVLWLVLLVYALWYFLSAKDYVPLDSREALLLWKIHKQQAKCGAKGWRKIQRRNKIVGFKCECGYKHLQKRPINISELTLYIQPETAIYGNVHNN